MVDEQNDLKTIRRRNFFAERDVPCPECGHNLRDVKGEICPECGLDLRIEHGRLAGAEEALLRVQGFGASVGIVLGMIVFALLMLTAGFWPDRWLWLVFPQFFVAAGFGYLAGRWCARRVNRSGWVKWNILDPASNAGKMMRLFVWLITGLFVVGIVYRVVITLNAIF